MSRQKARDLRSVPLIKSFGALAGADSSAAFSRQEHELRFLRHLSSIIACPNLVFSFC
jgi:hypothetical protein